jgi:hypothetical protein
MDNMEKYQTNSDIHIISKRYRYNLHIMMMIITIIIRDWGEGVTLTHPRSTDANI